MKIVVLGGTRFIGRALVSELVQAGHRVLLVHRGRHEPEELADLEHVHTDRRELDRHRHTLTSFAPDAVADLSAMTKNDANTALGLFGQVRSVVASSIDVYRAFSSVWDGSTTDAVPLTEESELRSEPPPDAMVPDGWDFDPASYEKIDVERAYLRRGAVVCRLPMVYGERDYKRREDFVLSRLRAGRTRIPIGSGNWLWSRGYVKEIARGMRLALESAEVGEVFNLAEQSCAPIALWMETIATAANADLELVKVPSDRLPDDLEIAGSIPQHWLVDSSKARERLGWVHANHEECVRQSVRWHMSNAPSTEPGDFADDDMALAEADRTRTRG
jgi:nucleoside-diphosphate-sugar epimerase